MRYSPTRIGWAGLTLTLGTCASGLTASALGYAATAPWRDTGLVRVDDVVVALVAGLGALVCVWLAASCAVGAVCLAGRVVGHGWRGGESALRRWAPATVRRVVAGAVGASVALGLVATGASATTVPDHLPTAGAVAAAASFATTEAPPLGWTVTSPTRDPRTPSAPSPTDEPQAPRTHLEPGAPESTGHAPVSRQPRADRGAEPARTVVVRAGDSLWGIAAARLGPGASDAEVAAAWPRWFEANRDVVGDDPDALVPGQVLTVPTTAGGGSE